MVSLMTQGGYDLVTASGDASLRLIRGGTVQPVDIARVPSYASVDERLREAPWHYVDGKHYGTPYQWGPNVLMYNTTAFKDAPTSWSVVFEGAEAARRQEQQGPRAGLRRPDLHRRRGALPDGEAARAGHQGPVRTQRGTVRCRARAAAQAAPAGAALLARRQRAGAGLHLRGHRRLGVLAVPGEHAGREQAAGGEHCAGRGRHGLGRHHHARRERQAPELRLQVDGVVAEPQGAGRRRRLVRLGAGRAGRVHGQCAAGRRGPARPTASTSSTRSTSGGRRSPPAPRAPACLTAAGQPTTSR